MNKDMFESISVLDNDCFNREGNFRSAENLGELLSNYPEGCFALIHDNEIVAYTFSRILGGVGFIGPLGVKSALRGKGFGKAIVEASRDTLIKAGCSSIGLEVAPDKSNNIGLYQKTGFFPAFPTITYRKKADFKTAGSDKVINAKEIDARFISAFDRSFSAEHQGYSLLKDIESAISHKGSGIYFYKDRDDILAGFLCYSPLICPFIWGAFLRDYSRKEVFEALFSKIEGDELKIRINSRYKKAIGIMGNSFEVERVMLRMMLKGYEGEYMSLDESSFVARSWVG